MKISQKQANLLAKEVFKKLIENDVAEVPQSMIDKVAAFKAKRAELSAVCNEADAALRKHDATLNKIVGGEVKGVYAINAEETIIASIKKSKTPAIDEIENRIILNAMFSTEDLNAFIERIVSEFTPAKKKILQS